MKAIDISDTIEKTFDYEKDILSITLNSIILEIPLVYVFSDLLDDFLQIITDLMEMEKGDGIYGFSQNDFFDADWILKWNLDLLVINVLWRKFKALEKDSLVSEKNQISKKDFLNSWKNLFIILSKYIDFKYIKLEYQEQKEIINRLINTNF